MRHPRASHHFLIMVAQKSADLRTRHVGANRWMFEPPIGKRGFATASEVATVGTFGASFVVRISQRGQLLTRMRHVGCALLATGVGFWRFVCCPRLKALTVTRIRRVGCGILVTVVDFGAPIHFRLKWLKGPTGMDLLAILIERSQRYEFVNHAKECFC